MPTNLVLHHTSKLKMLSFGVPLEEVFHENEVHFCLVLCLNRAYQFTNDQHINVEDIFNSSLHQGSVKERLFLKEKLILCQDVTHFQQIKVGTFVWVVRHFVGLLPSPLLNSGAWQKLAVICKKRLCEGNSRVKPNTELIRRIAKEFCNTPNRNFLFAEMLFTFMRDMSVLPRKPGEPKVGKLAAFALVKYFSSAIFLRPFRPGYIGKADRHYFPLTLFVLLKWPEISNACSQFNKKKSSKLMHKEQKFMNMYSADEYIMAKDTKDVATQIETCKQFLGRKTLEESFSEVEIRVLPQSYHGFDCLQDVASQTNEKREDENEEKCDREKLTNDPLAQIFFSSSLLEKELQEPLTFSSGSVSKITPEDVNNMNLNDDYMNYSEVKHFDPVVKELQSQAVKEKIAKICSTYSCELDSDCQHHDQTLSEIISVVDDSDSKDLETTKEIKSDSCLSSADKRSRTSITSIKSKISNLFGKSKSNDEVIRSNVKYEKI